MPSAVGGGHSHRATTKVSHKAFKSRKATKGQLRDAAKGMYESRRGIRVQACHFWTSEDLRKYIKMGQTSALLVRNDSWLTLHF